MKDPIKVIYIGGPTVILEIDGLRIITDPTLDPQEHSLSAPMIPLKN